MDTNSRSRKLPITYKRQKDIIVEYEIDEAEETKYRITWIGYDDKEHSRVVPMSWSAMYIVLMKGMTRDKSSVRIGEVY